MSEKSEAEQDYLIDDMGVVQNALASILPPDTHYYVNAEKNESLTASLGSAVYSYENTEDETQLSKAPLHHMASSSNGNCLTYSSTLSTTTTTDEFGTTIPTVSSSLQSVGVDCESKLQPLCFREVAASDLEFINEQCSDCNDPSVTPTCNKWEKMENLYEVGDTFIVTWMEICIDVCGPEVRQANEYCSVGLIIRQYTVATAILKTARFLPCIYFLKTSKKQAVFKLVVATVYNLLNFHCSAKNSRYSLLGT